MINHHRLDQRLARNPGEGKNPAKSPSLRALLALEETFVDYPNTFAKIDFVGAALVAAQYLAVKSSGKKFGEGVIIPETFFYCG